jgi:nucleoside-diphosphate-sugar epimerase
MKILITGTNGYVGKSLYNALKDKHKVYTITRDKCDLTNLDNVDLYFLDTWFDVVIHCAVKGGSRLQQDNWSVMDDNLSMYYNLLRNQSHFNKFIHFGSGAEIYSQDTPYGLSKHVINQSILDKNNFYNLRIFGVFDENELDKRFIKANIKRYINKEPIEIHEAKFMDFFYMPDLIKIVEYYINEENLPKEFDCVYSENYYSLFRLANLINELDDFKVKIVYEGKNGNDYVSKYRTSLPIEFIGLEQGIKQMYNKLKNEY